MDSRRLLDVYVGMVVTTLKLLLLFGHGRSHWRVDMTVPDPFAENLDTSLLYSLSWRWSNNKNGLKYWWRRASAAQVWRSEHRSEVIIEPIMWWQRWPKKKRKERKNTSFPLTFSLLLLSSRALTITSHPIVLWLRERHGGTIGSPVQLISVVLWR